MLAPLLPELSILASGQAPLDLCMVQHTMFTSRHGSRGFSWRHSLKGNGVAGTIRVFALQSDLDILELIALRGQRRIVSNLVQHFKACLASVRAAGRRGHIFTIVEHVFLCVVVVRS